MSLSGRDMEYLRLLQQDMQTATKEKAAKAAIKEAQADINAFTHLLNMRTITFEDLLTHKSFTAEHERLTAEYDAYVKEMTKNIETAKAEKKQAMRQLKTLQADAVILRNSLALKKATMTENEIQLVETLETHEPAKVQQAKPPKTRPLIAPSSSFFRPHIYSFRDQLMQDLKAYIVRIRSYVGEKGNIDFAYGFTIYPQSRAINRMANYLLACSLLKNLQKGKLIHMVFNNINEQRKDLILKHRLNNFKDYEKRDIHSATLNAIIDKVNDNEKQPLLLREMI